MYMYTYTYIYIHMNVNMCTCVQVDLALKPTSTTANIRTYHVPAEFPQIKVSVRNLARENPLKFSPGFEETGKCGSNGKFAQVELKSAEEEALRYTLRVDEGNDKVYTYMYRHTCMCLCIYLHIHMYIYIYVYITICIYIYRYTYIYILIYIHMYIRVYICKHTIIYSYIYMYVHLYIYIYIHTLRSDIPYLCTCICAGEMAPAWPYSWWCVDWNRFDSGVYCSQCRGDRVEFAQAKRSRAGTCMSVVVQSGAVWCSVLQCVAVCCSEEGPGLSSPKQNAPDPIMICLHVRHVWAGAVTTSSGRCCAAHLMKTFKPFHTHNQLRRRAW